MSNAGTVAPAAPPTTTGAAPPSEVAKPTPWSTNTAAIAVAGARTGTIVGFALGSVPGICLGAASGGLLGTAARGVGGPCCVSRKEEEPPDLADKSGGVPAKPESPLLLDSYMVAVRDSGGRGAVMGAEVAGTLTGMVFSVPGAVIGGVVGGAVGVCCDIREYFRTDSEVEAPKVA
mmetsp:Transcript_79185/g.227078  ORF Transcript_79185/g.227078 Transcript_79185/m.227078 type:complete len:176 (+) Transcript_79185:77-604(+)